MSLFLLIFFLVYGGMHAYVLIKARWSFGLGVPALMGVGTFFAFMTLAPYIIRQSERAGFDFLARLLSVAGYSWMGFLLLFISVSLPADIYFLIGRAVRAAGKDTPFLNLSPAATFLGPLLISGVLGTYSFFEATNIRTEQVVIRTSKLHSGAEKIRLVQISDVHAGLIVREGRIRRIVEAVRNAGPDIVVSTGDLVDGQIDSISVLAEEFGKIRPRLGKFAVTGNHEFYAGIGQSLDFTRRAGFTVLRENGVSINGVLTLVGVDDIVGRRFGLPEPVPESELREQHPARTFAVLLKHRPLLDDASRGLFDLQLSGHTHKGQLFPFSLVTKAYYPVDSGLSRTGDGSSLYVSRGSGTWGPPMRFLAPPEITIIDILPAEGGKRGKSE